MSSPLRDARGRDLPPRIPKKILKSESTLFRFIFDFMRVLSQAASSAGGEGS